MVSHPWFSFMKRFMVLIHAARELNDGCGFDTGCAVQITRKDLVEPALHESLLKAMAKASPV